MNETENKQQDYAANRPLNRFVTVHQIGYRDHAYYDAEAIEDYQVPWHLVEFKNIAKRHLAIHAIKEIGGFDLPVFKFEKVRKPGFLGLLGCSTVSYSKEKEVSGGWIRLYDGEFLCLAETYEELKSLIEGEKKEE